MTDRLFKTLVNAAKQALSARDLDEAERTVARLRESYPREAASGGLALELLLAEGNLDEATKLAEYLAKRFPGSAGVLFQAGMARFRSKEFSKALRLFEESEKLFPSRKTKRWRGKTLTNLGRFDDAEPLLINIFSRDPHCGVDLAWLYERKGDTARAMDFVTKHLERFPGDRLAQSQKTRLMAQALDGEGLIEQVEALDDLDEPIPEELVSKYISALVASGESEKARQIVKDSRDRLSRAPLLDLAWTCHRLQIHDLAYDLFAAVAESRLQDFKLLNTLEFSAKCAGRVQELVAIYENLAPKEPKLYGRIKRLKPSQ